MSSAMSALVETGYRLLAAGTSYTAWREFEQLRRNMGLPAVELEALRWRKLQTLLNHAWECSPFYRERWRQAGVDPRRFTRVEDLCNLPVVTKPDLIQAQAEDGFGLHRRRDFQMTHTSGSTGPRLYLPFTRQDLQLKYAAYLREFYATGWRLGERSAALHYSGHPEFGGRYTGAPDRDNFVWTRRLAFRMAHRRRLLTPYDAPSYRDDHPVPAEWYRVLRRHRPVLLESMDFNLLALYRHIRRCGLPPLRIPRMIVLATLAPEIRQRLEAFFETKIFNRFGPHEIEGVAIPCRVRSGLHIAMDCVVAEFLDAAHQPVEPGRIGHLVLTDLHSRVMPLIRYRIGDMAHAVPGPCACGCVFPRMGDIQGRERDVFADAAGRPVAAARVAARLQADPDLDLFQVVQDPAGRVQVRLPPPLQGDPAAAATRAIAAVRDVLGAGLPIEASPDAPLELEPNGKYCFAKRSAAPLRPTGD